MRKSMLKKELKIDTNPETKLKNFVARGHRLKYKIMSETLKEKVDWDKLERRLEGNSVAFGTAARDLKKVKITIRMTCSPLTPFTELETQKKVKMELPEVRDSKKNNFPL